MRGGKGIAAPSANRFGKVSPTRAEHVLADLDGDVPLILDYAKTDEERAMLRSMIMDSYQWFIGLVEERRPMTRAEVVSVADGSVFTGRQALQKKLVDELGGEDQAKAWLATKGVDGSLEIVEWKAKDSSWFLSPNAMAGILARLAGLPDSGGALLRELGGERLFLDGLLSVWQPEQAVWGD